MKIVTAEEVRRRLTVEKGIELMRQGLLALATGSAYQPIRTVTKLPNGEAFGFMPAYMGDEDYFGAKVITAFHKNAGTAYPSHMGYVMLFESKHGSFVGMADASAITEIRTGAVSGVATDLLARPSANTLAIIGAGAQARSHLAAMCAVRPIKTVRIFDIYASQAIKFKEEMSQKYEVDILVASSVKEAVKEADIICTLTPSKAAFLEASWISPGAHINAVGTFTPTTREITSDLMAASKLYADNIDAMKAESGEFIIPKSEGLIDDHHVKGTIGDLLLKRVEGRQSKDEITLFNALGLAIEDVICARYLCIENEM
jgi:ornithine cyclodeaminase